MRAADEYLSLREAEKKKRNRGGNASRTGEERWDGGKKPGRGRRSRNRVLGKRGLPFDWCRGIGKGERENVSSENWD